MVDILTPAAFGASRNVVNTSATTPVPAGYLVTERIVRWVFVAASGTVGWVPGDPATHTVYTQTVAGPTLGPGASAPINFGPVPSLPCGLYQETLTVDAGNTVTETDEGDNVGRHFFFVPSTQNFVINVIPVQTSIVHTAGPTNTHLFRITAAGAPAWRYGHFSYVANEGSTAATIPPRNTPGGPGPQVIQMVVTPKTHTISRFGLEPTVTGKITVISQDGCIIKQESAKAFIEHDVR
ncbi:MAG: hypothetical protein HXY26_07870 [Hydrogenophilaceae bacterium]|nr:hypothetical protein [Hydrogenophilaceae bacterium]